MGNTIPTSPPPEAPQPPATQGSVSYCALCVFGHTLRVSTVMNCNDQCILYGAFSLIASASMIADEGGNQVWQKDLLLLP